MRMAILCTRKCLIFKTADTWKNPPIFAIRKDIYEEKDSNPYVDIHNKLLIEGLLLNIYGMASLINVFKYNVLIQVTPIQLENQDITKTILATFLND